MKKKSRRKKPILSYPSLKAHLQQKKVTRTCSLCGKQGHYARTCRKPSSSKVIKKSKQYRKYVEQQQEKKGEEKCNENDPSDHEASDISDESEKHA